MAVRKVLIAAIICAGLYCSSARSADISLTSQLSQSAEFNSNYFLQTHPPGLTTVSNQLAESRRGCANSHRSFVWQCRSQLSNLCGSGGCRFYCRSGIEQGCARCA